MMPRQLFQKSLILWSVFFLWVGVQPDRPAWSKSLKVTQADQQLYKKPDFASPALTGVPKGATVPVLKETQDWYQITYQGKTGWMHQKAFAEKWSFVPDLNKMLLGPEVKQSGSDEVALAGKGFTPEVEKDFREKNPNLKYAQVDRIETFTADDKRLSRFAKEGGLAP